MPSRFACSVGGGSLRKVLFLLALFLLAAAARSLHYRQVFAGEEILYFGVDPYYHVRRSLLTALDYPRVPVSDFYAGYPRGMESHFAPLWDLMVATTARLLHPFPDTGPAGSQLEGAIYLWSALYPPLLGALTVLLCYRLARTFVPRLFAGLAGLLVATAPAHVDYTLLGRPDHHVLESLLSTLAVLLHLEPERREGSAGTWRTGLPLGLTLALALLSSAQCVIVPTLITADTLLRTRRGQAPADRLTRTLVSLLWAVLFLATGLVLLTPHNLLELHYDRPSLYQLSVLAGLLAPLLAIRIHRHPAGRFILSPYRAGGGVLGVWLLLALVLAGPTLDGLGFVGRAPAWIQDVEDASPLFFVGGTFNLRWPAGQLGLAWMGLPLWILLAWRGESGPRQASRETLLGWTVATLVLSLYQVRFLYFFWPAMACLLVLGGYDLLRWALRWRPQAAQTRDPGAVAASILLALVLLQIPALTALWSRRHLPVIDPDVVDACRWLRERTPETGFFEQPLARPGYGVLVPWDLGNQVILLARRPAVATASHQANQEGIAESIRFYLSRAEEEAVEILDRNGARYVVFESRVGDFNVQGPLVGMPGPYSIEERVDGRSFFRFTEKHARTLYARAHLHDGAGSPLDPPLQFLRLVYESPRAEAGFLGVHHIKIFERVASARLTGRGEAGDDVFVSARIRTNQGRLLEYNRESQVDGDGAFEVRWPYSSDPPPGHARIEGPVRVRWGGRELRLPGIYEEATRAGREVSLP